MARIIGLHVAALLPVLYLFVTLGYLSPIPYLDYWTAATQLLAEPPIIAIRLNEHVIPITGLTYLTNIYLFGGDNRVLIFFGAAAVFLQIVLLYSLLPESTKRNTSASIASVFHISLFLFSPVAYANWYEGFSAVHWQFASLGVLGAFYALLQYSDCRKEYYFWFSLLSALFGCLSFSSAYVSLPLLFLAGWYFGLSRGKLVLIVLFTLGLGALGYLFAYSTLYEVSAHPSHSASLTGVGFSKVALSLSFYLGHYFFPLHALNKYGVVPQQIVGGFSLVLFLVFSFAVLLKRNKAFVPWVLLGGFVLAAGLLTVFARGDAGYGMLAGSRYKTLTGLYWLAFFSLFAQWVFQLARGTKKKILVIFFGLILVALVFISKHSRELRYKSHQIQSRDLAALAYSLDMTDNKLFSAALTHNVKQLARLKPRLQEVSHVPFRKECPESIHLGDKKLAVLSPRVFNPSVVQGGSRISLKLRGNDFRERLCIFDSAGRRKGALLQGRLFRMRGALKREERLSVWSGYIGVDSIEKLNHFLVSVDGDDDDGGDVKYIGTITSSKGVQ